MKMKNGPWGAVGLTVLTAVFLASVFLLFDRTRPPGGPDTYVIVTEQYVPDVTPEPLPPLNINTATAEELEELNGIGSVLAQRIIDYRTANGPFETVEELLEVKGIGESTLARFREEITAE